jgi:hypothetical protein
VPLPPAKEERSKMERKMDGKNERER